MSDDRKELKSRFKADAEDGQFYDNDTPLTEEDERKANDIWAKISGQK
jgi:hypothetical protein